jgi:hypothetical protein
LEFRQGAIFADLDIFEDGDIIASTGGLNREVKAWRITPNELKTTLKLFRDHLNG